MSNRNKILKDVLTNKQRILQMVQRWDDDVSFDDAVYHMYVMKEVMQGTKEAEAGLGRDHNEVFDELERLCDEEEKQANLDAKRSAKPSGSASPNRPGRIPKNGHGVHKTSKKIGKPVA